MEAAFVDIGTPKNAVLYRGDVHFDADEVDGAGKGKNSGQNLKIEQMLRAKQTIICQVTKNPIGAKGRGSRKRCRCRGASSSSSPTARRTGSRSGSPTTSASASAGSSTG